MSWLQGWAGKAENFLNQIDQNAANVLNDPNSKPHTSSRMGDERNTATRSNSTVSEDDQNAISLFADQSDVEVRDEIMAEPRESNAHNLSLDIHDEDTVPWYDRVEEMQTEKQQFLNRIAILQQGHRKLRNDNSRLRVLLQKANEAVAVVTTEFEKYKLRAQNVLQERDDQLKVNKKQAYDTETDNTILRSFIEGFKDELRIEREKNQELSIKYQTVCNENEALKKKSFEANRMYHDTLAALEGALGRERAMTKHAEEELYTKRKEMQLRQMQLSERAQGLKEKDEELEQLKVQLRQLGNRPNNEDYEARIQSLTEMLMTKQTTIQTITTEKNALRLQLEKLENDYQRLMTKMQQTTINMDIANNTDDVKSQVPQYMRVTPLDAGVTKRVKRAYSTLDAISVRAGVFLRRYPLARVFGVLYCVFLHLWVIIILFSYVPSVR